MQTTPQANVQRSIITTATLEEAHKAPPPHDSRWLAVFGPNADPKLASKLFREDFAEYRRLQNVADSRQRTRR